MVEIKIKSTAPDRERIRALKQMLYPFLIIVILTIVLVILKKPECEPCVQQACPECICTLDCDDCPNKIIYQNDSTEVFKFVCMDSSIVDDPKECEVQEAELPELNPIKTNENGTLTKEVRVEPACVGGLRGGYVYYQVVSPPETVVYQIKPESGDYTDVITDVGLFKAFKEFIICDPNCPNKKYDFSLQSGKRYLIRLKFDRTKLYDKVEYSNEYIIDLTPESTFMTKDC